MIHYVCLGPISEKKLPFLVFLGQPSVFLKLAICGVKRGQTPPGQVWVSAFYTALPEISFAVGCKFWITFCVFSCQFYNITSSLCPSLFIDIPTLSHILLKVMIHSLHRCNLLLRLHGTHTVVFIECTCVGDVSSVYLVVMSSLSFYLLYECFNYLATYGN